MLPSWLAELMNQLSPFVDGAAIFLVVKLGARQTVHEARTTVIEQKLGITPPTGTRAVTEH